VVERGKGDKIYINTSGIGVIYDNAKIGIEYIKPNQSIIINRDIASHGMAIMSEREGLKFDSEILSDTKNLNFEVKKLIENFGEKIHFLRDATRGGLASVLNEITSESNLGIHLFEEKILVQRQVKSACELLGLNRSAMWTFMNSSVKNKIFADYYSVIKEGEEWYDVNPSTAVQTKTGNVIINTLMPPKSHTISR
jgi:hydrogenase expression/formation protein HypE